MRKLFFSKFFAGIFICLIVPFSFFLPKLLEGLIPVPADNLLALYHPFRDISADGYNAGKFPAKNPLITDPVLQIYPWKKLVVDNFKSFQIPYWNPYSFSGQPLAGNIQSSPFSILNILFLFLPFKFAWGAYVIVPTVLTSIFMYLFLSFNNKLKLGQSSAIFGAVALPFTGFYVAWLQWGTIVATAMWLPFLLYSIDKFMRGNRKSWFVLIAFAFTQTILAGHTQTSFYVILATLVYLAFFLREQFKKSVFVFLALLLAFIICAVQILPSLEFVVNSARSVDQGYSIGRLDWFIPPKHLLQIAIPDFFGNPSTYNYWGVWNYAEFVSFIGVVPLAFVMLNVFNKNKYFLIYPVSILLLSLLFAFKNPISLLPYSLNLPILSSFQPSRIVFLIDFSLVILAAAGFHTFLRMKTKKLVVIFALPFLVLLATYGAAYLFKNAFPHIDSLDASSIAARNTLFPLAISVILLFVAFIRLFRVFKIKEINFVLLVFALLIFELFRFGNKFTSFSKSSWIFPETKILHFLSSQERPFRVISTDRRILHPNVSSVYKIESVDGYDPLYLESYGKFVAGWQSGEFKSKSPSYNRIITPQKTDSRLLDLLNVKYILSFDEISNPNFLKIEQEGDTKLYENKTSMPRMFFVDELFQADDKSGFGLLLDPSFDLGKSAVSDQIKREKTLSSGTVEVEIYGDNYIKAKTVTTEEKGLIITNVYYPGWEAFLNGEKVSLYKADNLFQLVLVPPGKHSVELRYSYSHWRLSFLISAIGIVLMFFVLSYSKLKRFVFKKN